MNVWAESSLDSCNILGPFFIDGNLIAKVCENLLRDHIISEIENLFDSNVQNI